MSKAAHIVIDSKTDLRVVTALVGGVPRYAGDEPISVGRVFLK
jgi:hypothetical protein